MIITLPPFLCVHFSHSDLLFYSYVFSLFAHLSRFRNSPEMHTPTISFNLLVLSKTVLLFLSVFSANEYVAAETSTAVFLADSVSGDAIEYLIVEEADTETVSVICHVTDLQPNHVVSISRETRTGNGRVDPLVWNNNATTSANTEHIIFDGFINIGGNSFLYTLIINEVTRHDAGNYNCGVFTQSGNRFTPLTNDSAGLRVLYLPDDIYPICTVFSANKSLTRYAGDEVTFHCESELGDPEVFLDWMLSRSGPSLPRAKEVVDSGYSYSEIVVNLETGHSGKQFECQLGTGLQITYKPKCSIGPFDVQPLPTTPKPPSTPATPTKPTTISRTTPENIIRSTEKSRSTTGEFRSPLPAGTSGLSSGAIAGISVIIALCIGILLLVVLAWLIKAKRCLSFNIEEIENKQHPIDDTTRAMGGMGNLGTTLTLMMASERLEDPELLGWKRRVSKKASLKAEDDLEMGEEPLAFENGQLVRDFDTIAEHEESSSLSESGSKKYGIVNTEGFATDERDSPAMQSPTSPKDTHPFLSSAQPNEGYISTPSASPNNDGLPTHPDDDDGDELPLELPTGPDIQRDLPSSSASHYTDETLEGSFVDESEFNDDNLPPSGIPEQDSNKPKDLPQDVLDILMELDIDLFANEEEEDTNF